ncbi:penicillin-binding protein 1A [Solibacillus cecembensis]|uniref:PBP1A family penicillin-binding protein n=1 Tax=Solibacillus cecembensis TaxID=459347 RepID=UPI0007170AE3
MSEQKRTREDIKRERQSQKKKIQTKTPFGIWIKRIFLTVVLLGVVGFLGGAGLFAYYVSSAPDLDEELLKDPISSEFYDVNKELFATIGAEKRNYVKYEDIPVQMRDAIIATEDSRFFDHFGIDIWRLGSAVIANVRDGFGAQGASTITQQVVKNSFLKNEKKLKRKAQEAWLSIQLERKYSKEQIFEMYFNKILMSGRIYGFGTAAKEFYGKELDELTLDEAALLAGIPQSPNNYNPYKNPERAEKRRNIVLSLMVQHNKISQTEADSAKTANVTAGLIPDEKRIANTTTKYPAFLDVVLSEIEAKGETELLSEGIKVYTTLDPEAQKIVENTINNDSNFPNEQIQAGIAVVDTETGALRAVGGGRNYSGNLPYNHAYDLTTRSPGSTLKPLVDYGPAFEYLKWSTGETTVDEPITYTGSKQVITNWDSKYGGPMTVREALYTSRNIPAVKTFREVGADRSKQFLANIGIRTDKQLVESDAIGGGRIAISPIQMAASYAAFGNNGTYNDAHAISKIVFRDGSSSDSYKPKQKIAMSDYTAYMVTDILRDVVSTKPNASAKRAMVSGVDIAGKTGTTNYSSDEFKKFNLKKNSVPDTWFAGYTTNYSIAIWGGHSLRKDAISTWEERWLPQTLFKTIMTDLDKHNPSSKFKQPSSVVSATIEVGSNPLKLASEYTPNTHRKTELFVKGTEPKVVSEQFVQETLDAPTNLHALYNDTTQLVDLTWAHPSLTQEDGSPVTFEVTMNADGEAPTVVSVTSSLAIQISNIEPGKTYTFSVVALADDIRSEPVSTSIYINQDTSLEEPVIPEIPGIDDEDSNLPINPEEPNPDEGNENNGNGNDQGNGNNGNGNGNNGNGQGNGNNGNGNGNNNTEPPDIGTNPIPPSPPTSLEPGAEEEPVVDGE